MSAETETPNVETSQPAGIETLGKRASAIKALVALVVMLVTAGATSVAYLSRYALAAEVAKHESSTEQRLGAIERQAATTETRISVLEALVRGVELELRWQRDQAVETARRVGARVVPAPSKRE